MPFVEISGYPHFTQASTHANELDSTSSRVYILKGNMPADISNSALQNTTNFESEYSNDILLTFNVLANSIDSSPHITADVDNKVYTKLVYNAVASQSGEATWWILGRFGSSANKAVWGDITDYASDGSMRLADTNIVQGELYTVGKIQFRHKHRFDW